MELELFDWKVKLGLGFTVALFIASVVSFIFAWNSPVPTDAFSAVTKYIRYRWFALFVFGLFSIGGATIGHYKKRVNRF